MSCSLDQLCQWQDGQGKSLWRRDISHRILNAIPIQPVILCLKRMASVKNLPHEWVGENRHRDVKKRSSMTSYHIEGFLCAFNVCFSLFQATMAFTMWCRLFQSCLTRKPRSTRPLLLGDLCQFSFPRWQVSWERTWILCCVPCSVKCSKQKL